MAQVSENDDISIFASSFDISPYCIMILHIFITAYALHPQTDRSRPTVSWIYELADIISLCERNIFAELHIDHIILGSGKISDI